MVIYCLARLIKKYEATDTMIIFISKERETLQDMILSTYEETFFDLFNELVNINQLDTDEALKIAEMASKNFIKDFYIVSTPLI